MDEEHAPDTRASILDVARELFVHQGYVETPLSQIARRVGLTKAAVLYHFPTKDALLMELAEPMLAALERTLDSAELMPPRQARWAVVEGILDVTFDHLRLLAIANAAWVARDPVYHRVLAINNRALTIIAGPEATLRDQVRASAALALLARPALFHREYPRQDVRREVLDAAVQLLEDSDTPPTTPRGNSPDRRRVMTRDKVTEAERLHKTGTHTAEDIARTLGVSRATVYRYLNTTPTRSQNETT